MRVPRSALAWFWSRSWICGRWRAAPTFQLETRENAAPTSLGAASPGPRGPSDEARAILSGTKPSASWSSPARDADRLEESRRWRGSADQLHRERRARHVMREGGWTSMTDPACLRTQQLLGTLVPALQAKELRGPCGPCLGVSYSLGSAAGWRSEMRPCAGPDAPAARLGTAQPCLRSGIFVEAIAGAAESRSAKRRPSAIRWRPSTASKA